MALSSFLLPGPDKGKAKAIDKGLDDLFRATVPVSSRRPSIPVTDTLNNAVMHSFEKKRKAMEDASIGKAKRSRPEAAATSSSSKTPAKTTVRMKVSEDNESRDEDEAEDGDASEEEDDVERGSGDSDDEGDPSQLVHESLLKGSESKGQSRHGKTKHISMEETSEQRDARTVFVGNVAIDVAKSRPAQKRLKRHILSFVPSAKIESIRFRSVAFKQPTAELPDDNRKSKSREHNRDRAANWRGDDKDEAEAAPAKTYLTPKEKKRIAFIKHDIHDRMDAANAYIVFAHPLSAESLAARPANVPPPAPVMDPYEAARTCAEKGDGSTFLGRMLRVDVIKKGGAAGLGAGVRAGQSGETAMAGDPKATVFVGNLDFVSKEEDLRAFFESLVTEERGKPGEKGSEDSNTEDDEEEEGEDEEAETARGKGANKPRTWVKRVRIIRDRDTQLGKGFAYVQFLDRECVDEILALDQSKLKFAKRKLRVQRCKTLPGGPKLRAARPSRPSTSSASSSRPTNNPSSASSSRPARLVPATKHTPKGNPELGAKLAHLPKEERKRVKAADPDRLARRLAKKRAKALAEKGVKTRGDKERERVRKRPGEKKEGQTREGKPKKRVRSGKALAKMNTKK